MKIEKADIFKNAKELFCSKGFKDTSVSDITKKTGISVGSFYNFYKSKEEVFFHVFMAENHELNKKVMNEVDMEGDPADIMKKLIFKMFNDARENPILREWFNKDVYNKLTIYIREYEENHGLEEEHSYNLFIGFIRRWQKEGKFRNDIETEMILAILNTFQYIDMHKEEIGSSFFPELLEHVIEFVVRGLSQQE